MAEQSISTDICSPIACLGAVLAHLRRQERPSPPA